MYVEHVRSTGGLDALLEFVVDILKITSARPIDASKFSVEIFDFSEMRSEPYAVEAQALAAHLYYLSLLYLPSLTRSWWFESKNKIKTPVESWTQNYVSATNLIRVQAV